MFALACLQARLQIGLGQERAVQSAREAIGGPATGATNSSESSKGGSKGNSTKG